MKKKVPSIQRAIEILTIAGFKRDLTRSSKSDLVLANPTAFHRVHGQEKETVHVTRTKNRFYLEGSPSFIRNLS